MEKPVCLESRGEGGYLVLSPTLLALVRTRGTSGMNPASLLPKRSLTV